MARPLRIEYPGALYHVTSRGNARQNIFLDNMETIRGMINGRTDLKEISRAQKHTGRKSLNRLLEKKGVNIELGVYEAYVEHGYRMNQIADYLGVHYSTVSRIIKRVEAE